MTRPAELLELAREAAQGAVPPGWTVMAGQGPDYTHQLVDMALYPGRLAFAGFGGRIQVAEVLSLRVSLATLPTVQEAYLEVLNVRDDLAQAVTLAGLEWAELGVELDLERGVEVGAALPVMSAAKGVLWSAEIKFSLRRSL